MATELEPRAGRELGALVHKESLPHLRDRSLLIEASRVQLLERRDLGEIEDVSERHLVSGDLDAAVPVHREVPERMRERQVAKDGQERDGGEQHPKQTDAGRGGDTASPKHVRPARR